VPRPTSQQYGSVTNAGPPATLVKLSGANFVVSGATFTRAVVWWEWHRQQQAIALTAQPTWAGQMGFCIVNTGDAVPDPISNPNDPRWLKRFPVTPRQAATINTWYDSGTPATRQWSFYGNEVELETQRKIPAAGAALWWSWNLGFTPASTDRISLAWWAIQDLP
jgi:hypothetical protein